MEFFKKNFRVFALTFGVLFAFSAFFGCGNSNPSDDALATDYIITPASPEYEEISAQVLQTEYKTFYFDANDGDDENNGLNIDYPKKSLSEIANIIADYADRYPVRILLKKGTTFNENLTLTGYKATESRPFILDAYGEGDAYPVIYGNGTINTYTDVLHLEEDNTRILNIEITGPDCARGIYIFPRKGGIYENIVVAGCYVHDVNWLWDYATAPDNTNPDDINPEKVTPTGENNRYRRLYGGICVFTGDVSNSLGAPITFRNIWINSNRVENVSHLGINFYNYWVNRPGVGYGYNKFVDATTEYNNYETGVGYFPMENIVVSGNYTNCIGGDGVVVAGADNVWLEKNVCYKSNYLGRAGFWNGGIWVHNVRTCYYQCNEAGYTYLRHGSSDGEGFDIDNTCENVYMQYNYSHHNEGGGVLICNLETTMLKFNSDGTPVSDRLSDYWGQWKNNYVRNNVFVNNGNARDNTKSAFLTVARAVNDVCFENNTVIISGGIKGQHVINCEDNVLATGHVYKNNIFYCTSDTAEPIFDISTLKAPVFENNLYFNIKSGDALYGQLVLSDDEKAILNVDPQISAVSDFKGYLKALAFAGKNAVLYKGGATLKTALKYDFNGNDATNINYLGAFAAMP